MDTRKLTSRTGYAPHNQALIYDEATGVDVAVTYSDQDGQTAAELARRWNAFPALVAKLSAYVNEVEEYGFIGVQGVSEDNENHYTGSPSYFEAKQLLNTLAQ